MFRYPLVLERDTQYGRLSITPDATSADIRNAKTELATAYAAQIRQSQARLAKVDAAVPELQKHRSAVKDLRDKKASPAQLKPAQQDLADAEKRAAAVDPGYRDVEAEIERLERKVNEINSIKLEDEEERRRYDLDTPPCALLKLSEQSVPVFESRRIMLAAVRREVSAFIEERLGVPCYHPTDETRRLFLADFEANETLDRGLR
jgi:chromosome segregation ATPase